MPRPTNMSSNGLFYNTVILYLNVILELSQGIIYQDRIMNIFNAHTKQMLTVGGEENSTQNELINM